ncbi:MAG: SH3 domain-containing protein, partial [Myxococcota bacterium]
FEALIDAGVRDPDVHYDLALTEARRERLGSAIRHFRIALELRPGDAEAEAGLAAARTALVSARAESEGSATVQEGAPLVETLAGGFSEAALAWSVIALLVLFLGASTLRTRTRGTPRLAASLAMAILLPLGLIAGTGVAARRGAFREGPRAIVLLDRVPLREGPDERAQVRSEAREGEDAQVVGRDERWRRIKLPGGREGWAPAEAIGLVDEDT